MTAASRPLPSHSWLAALAICFCQLACEASPPASPLPQVDVPPVQSAAQRETIASARPTDRYDLERDERRGGHTLARHVGQSDADLSQRLRREPNISAASTYTDRDTAERVVGLALAQHRTRINHWLGRQGPRPNLALDYRSPRAEPIGRSLIRRGRQAVVCTNAVVVLRWDGRDAFYVLTSYPEVSR
jgi:hypothetical protein